MSFWRKKEPPATTTPPEEWEAQVIVPDGDEEITSNSENGVAENDDASFALSLEKTAEEGPLLVAGEAGARGRRKAGGKRKLRRVLPAAVVTLVYLLLVFFLFTNAQDAARSSAAVSIRYRTPLPSAQVTAAKRMLGSPDVAAEFSAAFWFASSSEEIVTDRDTVQTPTMFVDGDMASVMPVKFLHGGYPAALEKDGMAISQGLAWKLFGGVNVVGTELEWKRATYTVRGVFAGDEPLLLAQVDANDKQVENYSGAELTGVSETDPREAAKIFAQLVGLEEPDINMDAKIIPGLIGGLAWFPAIVLIVWFVLQILRLLRYVTFWKRQLVYFAMLLGAAVLFPALLDMIPGWMIPTQWSDFDHWSAIFKQLGAYVTEWLSLWPTPADVQLKKQLIWQVVLLIPTLFATTAAIRAWGTLLKKNEIARRVRRAQAGGAALVLPPVRKQEKQEKRQEPQKDTPLLYKGEDEEEDAPMS